VFKLTSDDTHRSVMTAPYSQVAQKSGEPAAWLAFQCAGAGCSLAHVATGSGQTYKIPQSRLAGEDHHLAAMNTVLVNAE
jgi:hypothetical protein